MANKRIQVYLTNLKPYVSTCYDVVVLFMTNCYFCNMFSGTLGVCLHVYTNRKLTDFRHEGNIGKTTCIFNICKDLLNRQIVLSG